LNVFQQCEGRENRYLVFKVVVLYPRVGGKYPLLPPLAPLILFEIFIGKWSKKIEKTPFSDVSADIIIAQIPYTRFERLK